MVLARPKKRCWMNSNQLMVRQLNRFWRPEWKWNLFEDFSSLLPPEVAVATRNYTSLPSLIDGSSVRDEPFYRDTSSSAKDEPALNEARDGLVCNGRSARFRPKKKTKDRERRTEEEPERCSWRALPLRDNTRQIIQQENDIFMNNFIIVALTSTFVLFSCDRCLSLNAAWRHALLLVDFVHSLQPGVEKAFSAR